VLFFVPVDHGLLWPGGLTFFGRGKVIISAQILRDIIAALIYVVALGAHVKGWLWWQARGQAQDRDARADVAYGRPLVRKA